jgi:hypothetical protein
MEYQEYGYATRTDDGTWATAPTSSAPLTSTPSGQLMPLTPNPLMQVNPQSQSASPETLMIASFLQTVQQTQTQQMFLLRSLDARLARLETRPVALEATNVRPISSASFERATWWALWGMLMVILGGALAIVLFLILINIQFR